MQAFRFTAAAAAAALSLYLAAPALAADALPTLIVHGHGAVAAPPDQAVISAGVQSQAATAAEAFAEANRLTARVIASLKEGGIEARDLQTSRLTLHPVYPRRRDDEQPPAPLGFQAGNQLTIRVRDIAQVADVIDRLTRAGINTVGGIQFSIADPLPLGDQARRLAVRDARRKAELYAAEAGVRIGRVISIQEGQVAGPVPELRGLSAATEAIAIGETSITAAVTVTYALR